jgi:carbon-monoxide dehydrogenase small subunit
VAEHDDEVRIACTVNGESVLARVPARLTVADFVRDRLRLTGTHLGCEHGVCGACTLLVDGRSVRSCLMFAAQLDGRTVTTVEGLTAGGRNADLCAAMSAEHGLQCGFCTPGFLASAAELLDAGDRPAEEGLADTEPLDEAAVREALSGNVCRCTGYSGIVRAVLATANGRSGRGPSTAPPGSE